MHHSTHPCDQPGGCLVVTTINKSPLAGALAIFAAEQVLGLVAPGTHQYTKLVSPKELGAALQAVDSTLVLGPPQALWFDPLCGKWSAPAAWPAWGLVNYAMVATKPRPEL
jgi:2-polyprenyl-6-hydroxyphenyl methylase/3-demethylubiquinone-9 3-methyltransferase